MTLVCGQERPKTLHTHTHMHTYTHMHTLGHLKVLDCGSAMYGSSGLLPFL